MFLYTDSMDFHADHADMYKEGWIITDHTDVIPSTSGGRFGAGSVRTENDATYAAIQRPIKTAGQTVFVQAAFRVDYVEEYSLTHPFMVFRNIPNNTSSTSDIIAELKLRPNGALVVEDAKSPVDYVGTTKGGIIKTQIWHYIEVMVLSDPSDGIIQIRMDGVDVFYADGLDTSGFGSGGGSDDVRSVQFLGASWNPSYGVTWDDIVILDDAGLAPHNGFLGDVRIYPLIVNGDTGEANWSLSSGSNGYELINDTIPGGDDDDGTYIYSGNVGDKSSFDLETLSDNMEQIYGVVSVVSARKDGAGTNIRMRPYLQTTLSDNNGSPFVWATDYQVFRDYWGRNPDTGDLWLQAELDTLKLGVEVIS